MSNIESCVSLTDVHGDADRSESAITSISVITAINRNVYEGPARKRPAIEHLDPNNRVENNVVYDATKPTGQLQ